MDAINLQSIDERLVEEIARLAEANRHSLEQEVVSLIQDGLRTRARQRELADSLDLIAAMTPNGVKQTESRRDSADRIAAMTPEGVKQTDSVVLLREDRAR